MENREKESIEKLKEAHNKKILVGEKIKFLRSLPEFKAVDEILNDLKNKCLSELTAEYELINNINVKVSKEETQVRQRVYNRMNYLLNVFDNAIVQMNNSINEISKLEQSKENFERVKHSLN